MSSVKPTMPAMRHLEQDRVHGTGTMLENARKDEKPPQSQTNPSDSQEPFPALESQPEFQYNASLHALDTSGDSQAPASTHVYTPISGLKIQTDHLAQKNRSEFRSIGSEAISEAIPEASQPTVFNAGLPVRHSSIRSTHSARNRRSDSLSPASNFSSPAVGPLVDMTPLPSPISAWEFPNPGQWRQSVEEEREDVTSGAQYTRTTPEVSGPYIEYGRMSPKKRKIPILSGAEGDQSSQPNHDQTTAHARNRSLSDYNPGEMQIARSRNIAVSSSIAPPTSQQLSPSNDLMHREAYLAVQRGIAISSPPTPPDSNKGRASEELERPSSPRKVSSSNHYYEAKTIRQRVTRRWRELRQLGKGQFSKVMLATSSLDNEFTEIDPLEAEKRLDPKSLVAVKICNHGPAGGADEKSIRNGITRELELMKSIDHPSLVHLKAVSQEDRQTLFVLNYCPGGDLFDLASAKSDILKPALLRRIFAELVGAVLFLHAHYIVHRDIKLENILVNLRTDLLAETIDFQIYNKPVVTLCDLGLGRDIPRPPESVLLNRRCGSEDYAAPEVLMGQDYDGRSTDAWALGVVLYSLMEGRMPFDQIPGSRRKSPTSHKIARCEWQWLKWANANGDWDEDKGKDLEGAREVVEGLIARKRDRWDLDRVGKTEWVAGGIQVEGGLIADDEDE